MIPAGRLALAGALACACACGPRPQPTRVDDAAKRDAVHAISEESVELYAGREARLLALAHRIRTTGVEFCGEERGRALGLAPWKGRERFYRSFSEAFERRYGIALGEVGVVAVLPGSPAERAGVQAGDRILEVGGGGVGDEQDVFDRANDVEEGSVRLRVEREGRELALAIDAPPACRPAVTLVVSDWLTTVRQGNHVGVTSGLLRFVESDDELAVLIGHEMAHRVQGGAFFFDTDVEHRADRLGLRLAARAGYDVSGAPALWDRLALEHPWQVVEDSGYRWSRRFPHGRIPERAPVLRRVVREILARPADGPSVPEPEAGP